MGLGAWLRTSVDAQLDQPFLRYGADSSGEVRRARLRRADPTPTDMFGAEIRSAQEDLLKQKREAASDHRRRRWRLGRPWRVHRRRHRGPLRGHAGARAPHGLAGEGDGGLPFTLIMLPEGMNESEAMEAGQGKMLP